MRIAIVGTGISGLAVAHKLHAQHDLSLFEAGAYVGGHTNTVDVTLHSRTWAVDTGFIVFNDWTYPRFIGLMDELGVASQATSMSFSVKSEKTGLEYNGTSFDTLFAQRRNLFRPSYWGMLRDITRFNQQAKALLAQADDTPDTSLTLGTFLRQGNYGQLFIEHYVIPMGAAIWSASREDMLQFPMHFFARFFNNHGMLNIGDRPVWRVIKGGSRNYIGPLTTPFKDRIRCQAPVTSIRRTQEGVYLRVRDEEEQFFDQVVLACHADQALGMLQDPSGDEREILGALPYQPNEAILHTDHRVLPRARKAWAAWNYHVLSKDSDRVAVTYNMNILQGLDAPETFCVTLNHSEGVDPSKIIRRIAYAHPTFTTAGVVAQARHGEISGHNHTHYCGAYWFNGFHEDGLRSGLRVAEHIQTRKREVAPVLEEALV